MGIDIKILDAIGRKWQCGTIQVDMNLPERFEMEYNTEDNSKRRPVMIHRAILGSFERFIGILTEHCAGEFPFAIAPTQVISVPHVQYAKELQRALLEDEMDSKIFDMNESLNKRIRMAENQRVPMIVVIVDEEVENKTVALRDRRKREQSNMTKAEFISMLNE